MSHKLFIEIMLSLNCICVSFIFYKMVNDLKKVDALFIIKKQKIFKIILLTASVVIIIFFLLMIGRLNFFFAFFHTALLLLSFLNFRIEFSKRKKELRIN
jgi:hypothetical protein